MFLGRCLALGVERMDRADVIVFFFLAWAGALVVAATAATGPAALLVARLVGDVVTGGAF